jgi:hypothetical protein
MRTVYVFAPISEYSANIRFSVFINFLKNTKEFDKIVVVCFDTLFSIFPDADEFITVSKNFLNKTNSSFPNILENMDLRNNSSFHKLSIEYINKIKNENDLVLFWDDFSITDDNNNVLYENYIDINPYMTNPVTQTHDPLGATYRRDYNKLNGIISNNFYTAPTLNDYKKIKNNYSNLFKNENTVTIVTRNFKKKQPIYNTDNLIPNLKNFINHLINNGITVVNIGFPPVNFNFDNENYFEINDDLSQGELLSLFYLSKLSIFNFENAGYQVHAVSKINVLKILTEFQGEFIFSGRKLNTDILTEDITEMINNNDFENILSIIKNCKRIDDLVFSENKKITYVDL